MKQEILRKLIHLSSLIYPFLYIYVLNKGLMLLLTLTIASTLFCIDLLRLNSPFFKKLFNKIFKSVSRKEEEAGGIYGSTYFMIGTFLTILFFKEEVAILSLFVLIVSDTCASIFGKAFKSKVLISGKTLIGFLAFFVSAFFISPANFVAAFITSIAELFSKKLKIDDNIIIPLTYGIVCSIFI